MPNAQHSLLVSEDESVDDIPNSFPTSGWKQFVILFQRTFLSIIRDGVSYYISYFDSLFINVTNINYLIKSEIKQKYRDSFSSLKLISLQSHEILCLRRSINYFLLISDVDEDATMFPLAYWPSHRNVVLQHR